MRTFRTLGAVLIVAGVGAAAYGLAFSRVFEPAGRTLPPMVSADNPTSAAKVALGRRLFYDRALSFDNSIACASCHRQEFAFADPRPRSLGATGEPTTRHAMTLANVAFNARFNWANNTLKTLEAQALLPFLDEHPLEMGLRRNEREVLARLRRDAALFEAAFPGDGEGVSLDHVVKALGAFQRTLISSNSPYNRFIAGDARALSQSAQRGMALFNSSTLACTRCHNGFNFRETPAHRKDDADDSVAYHNIGLYNVDGAGAYPADDVGLVALTGAPEDMGRFKAPTLRNVAVTGPYMHDGSVATLEEVIAIYAAGGRHIESGPHAGDGRANPHKSPFITPFAITLSETRDLLAFLDGLTDTAFLTNPAFSDPFSEGLELSAKPATVMQDRLRAGGSAPAVVIVPSGTLPVNVLGAAHFPRQVAVARTETTVGEFRRFVTATGYQAGAGLLLSHAPAGVEAQRRRESSAPVFAQTDAHPVTCVTFEDAQAYATWLSGETGRTYRLPSELEFEYVNRAAHMGDYGFEIREIQDLCAKVNGADRAAGFKYVNGCTDGYEATSPAGSFPPNDFGLYDTTGNLWELTTDCAQWGSMRVMRGLFATLVSFGHRDGAIPHGGSCSGRHVIRGGSYLSSTKNLKAGFREIEGYRSARTGFRVVRELR